MQPKMDMVHRTGIVHQAADALSCLPSTNGCAGFLDDGMWIGLIVLHNEKTCLIQPYADVYFQLEDDVGVEVLQVPR